MESKFQIKVYYWKVILVRVIGFCVFNRPGRGLFRAFLNFQPFSLKKFVPWFTLEPPRHQGQITDFDFLSLGMDQVKTGHCTVSANQLTNNTIKMWIWTHNCLYVLFGLVRKCNSLLHRYSIGKTLFDLT